VSETQPTPARTGLALVYCYQPEADFVRLVTLDGETVTPPTGTSANGGTIFATLKVDVAQLPLIAVFSRDAEGADDIAVQNLNPPRHEAAAAAIIFSGPTVVNLG
jgi:hypothetical protein